MCPINCRQCERRGVLVFGQALPSSGMQFPLSRRILFRVESEDWKGEMNAMGEEGLKVAGDFALF